VGPKKKGKKEKKAPQWSKPTEGEGGKEKKKKGGCSTASLKGKKKKKKRKRTLEKGSPQRGEGKREYPGPLGEKKGIGGKKKELAISV